MENEFDFFNNLNFGTDFTKQGLGGYGTYTDTYNSPVIDTPDPVLIESTGIETIPGPIEPFINQGGNDNRGIPILKTSTYNATLEDEVNQTDLETAKNDTNIKDLINMGLGKQAVDYVKNNYGYMIMNLIFPGSGIVAKDVIERKNKREDAARRVEEENILLDKQNALIASKEAEEAAFQATLNQQQERQRRADLERIERAYRQDTGSGGGSYATGESGQQSDGSYNDPFDPGGGEKDGGHIDGTNRRRYGMGGIVSL